MLGSLLVRISLGVYQELVAFSEAAPVNLSNKSGAKLVCKDLCETHSFFSLTAFLNTCIFSIFGGLTHNQSPSQDKVSIGQTFAGGNVH